ncbi:MAG: DHH family phosphoesterase [Erysipelotrichaceae bacterium]
MNPLFELVEKYDIITLFRHVGADGDALGSQFGLKTWIQETYPHKQVYALGLDLGSHAPLFDPIDQDVSDQTIANSLAIVLDTANAQRVDDQRFSSAREILKIDHHIRVDDYAKNEIVDVDACATCQILTNLFRKNNIKLSQKCAKFLYYGLSSDTNNFTIDAVTSETFLDAAYLKDFGLDLSAINYDLRSKALHVFEYETFLRSSLVVDDKIVYAIVSKEDYEQFGLSFVEAKEKVYVLSSLRGIEIWCLFVESGEEDGNIHYNGSLRSLRTPINTIANNYHGGGHRLACGVKQLRREDIAALLADLKQAI